MFNLLIILFLERTVLNSVLFKYIRFLYSMFGFFPDLEMESLALRKNFKLHLDSRG